MNINLGRAWFIIILGQKARAPLCLFSKKDNTECINRGSHAIRLNSIGLSSPGELFS